VRANSSQLENSTPKTLYTLPKLRDEKDPLGIVLDLFISEQIKHVKSRLLLIKVPLIFPS